MQARLDALQLAALNPTLCVARLHHHINVRQRPPAWCMHDRMNEESSSAAGWLQAAIPCPHDCPLHGLVCSVLKPAALLQMLVSTSKPLPKMRPPPPPKAHAAADLPDAAPSAPPFAKQQQASARGRGAKALAGASGSKRGGGAKTLGKQVKK